MCGQREAGKGERADEEQTGVKGIRERADQEEIRPDKEFDKAKTQFIISSIILKIFIYSFQV